jgi:hypothetical protein
MNTELLKSKKFRAALLAAISSILTFLVSKFGFAMDVNEIMTLIMTISTPFLIYIGAEGVSEIQAKKVIEENKVRDKLTTDLLEAMKNNDQNNDQIAN